jgi:phosphate:Na+ symporter
MTISAGQMTIELLGGLALFLFGIDQLTDSLKAVAGDRMKTILARLTSTRISGALTGAFVTAVIQSSSRSASSWAPISARQSRPRSSPSK